MGIFTPSEQEMKLELKELMKKKKALNMVVTTTDFIPGKTIKEIVGLVTSTAISMPHKLHLVHEIEIAEKAKEMGADAVIGVVATTHSGGVTALVGTAVILEDAQ